MAGLLSLPTEVLQDLCAGAMDKTLRLVCKQINFAIEPRIMSTISLSSRRLSSQVEGLVTTHLGPTSASKYATQLKIRSIYPWKYENRVVSSEEEANIRSFLQPAIGSLIRVRKVVWDLHNSDPEWAIILVINALASLSFLEHFHLCVWSSPDPPLQLRRFSNLKKLSLRCGYRLDDDELNAIILPVATLIGWSQGTLTAIVIDNQGYDSDSDENEPTLQGFLAEISSSVCLNITHLSLSGLVVKLDATAIRHLRSLISLTIGDISTPMDPISGDQDEGAGFFSGEIWSTLRSEKIYLQEIVTHDIQPAFIEYLTSFSGLRHLRLPRASSYLMTPLISDQLAVQFYERALQNHAHSLESLEIDSSFEGKWSFGRHCSRIIEKCVCLASLKLTINSQDIPRREDKGDHKEEVDDEGTAKREGEASTGGENPIWLLLDICATLPVLKNLTLLSASPKYNRGSRCGTTSNLHRERTNVRIAEDLECYAPITSRHVFRVSTIRKEFGVRCDEFGMGLRYQPIAQIKEEY